MSQSPLQRLRDKVFKRKIGTEQTGLTSIMDMVRSFGCLGELIGREFEIYDASGKLLGKIKQKPIKFKQLNTLLKEHDVLKRIDAEIEAKKFGGKTGGKKRLGK